MLHRTREAFADIAPIFAGPVEVDESYFGRLRKNMSNKRRKELEGTGPAPVGKTAVAAAKNRETKQVVARVVPCSSGATKESTTGSRRSNSSGTLPQHAGTETVRRGRAGREAAHVPGFHRPERRLAVPS